MLRISAEAMVLLGAFVTMLAGVGIARFPDVFSRLQVTTKASTLGIGAIAFGVAIGFQDLGVAIRCVLIVAFVMRTSPVAAHLIGRAAFRKICPPPASTDADKGA